jgi:hypothetical protein
MYLFLQSQVLSIEIWHLGLTVVAIIISLVVMFINLERSRKKDLNHHLEKKADATELEALEKRVNKIDEDCSEKTKELKKDFLNKISSIEKKFDMLMKEVIEIIKDNKK